MRTLLQSSWAVLALLAACSSTTDLPPTDTSSSGGPSPGGSGGSSSGSSGSSSGTSDDAGSSGTSATCGFASTGTPYTFPTVTGQPTTPFPTYGAGSVACPSGSGEESYSIYDMNGDGLLDLVVTSSCADATVGTEVWLVYLGTASGFATAATRFALVPAPASSCSTTASLVDVNGDLAPDWLVTATCNDSTVGTSRWLVYFNQGSGFATTASPYTLPVGAVANSFVTTYQAADSCTGGAGPPAYSFFDITGDSIPDLVETATCDDAAVGTNYWRVYAGSTSGIVTPAIQFALPTSPTFSSGTFTTFSSQLDCVAPASKPTFGLLDFNDDGKIDVVATEVCSDTSVGSTRWLFYPNGGSGFATSPETIGLPSIAGTSGVVFPGFTGASKCTGGATQPAYMLADGNRDGHVDLIVTANCGNPLVGESFWALYLNDGTSFSSPANELALPTVLGATTASPASTTSSAAACSAAPQRPGYALEYFPQWLSFVVTDSCSDSTVGQTKWVVYSASCQ